jgi:hypothetical protein
MHVEKILFVHKRLSLLAYASIVSEVIKLLYSTLYKYTAAYLLQARSVEPEKQALLAKALKQHSFLGNGRETNNGATSVARW